MPLLQFRNFGRLAFLQAIDKPRFLAPLLAPYAAFFSRHGIDVTRLRNDDRTERRLLKAFTDPEEDAPGELLEALYLLDDLADEFGPDRISEEAARLGIALDDPGHDLTAAERVIAVYRAHPELVRACYERLRPVRVRACQEYQARTHGHLTFAVAESRRSWLEEALGSWFAERNRSRACEIYIYPEQDEIHFQVVHGAVFRTEGAIDRRLKRSRVAYRPQRHDEVVYHTRTGVLRVSAQTPAEKEAYRAIFGEVLFGDRDQFPPGDLYTLEPLRRGREALRRARGVAWATLIEVAVQHEDRYGLLQVSRTPDLMASIEENGRPNLAEGRLVWAVFLLEYTSGRPRRLELRPPNIALYDRDRDGAAAEAFLALNGYLKVDPRRSDGE